MTTIETMPNGFEYINIKNSSSSAKIALQGAHIFHFQPKDLQALLWVSEKSRFEEGIAIRGGVPICWPWFGEHPNNPNLPKHGFARISMWEIESITEKDADTTEVILSLSSSNLFAYRFKLTAHFIIAKELTINLTTQSLDENAFSISQALHTYFAVDKIENTTVSGLEKREYTDFQTKTDHVQNGSITIDTEVDRIYHDVTYPLSIDDKKRRISIGASGSQSSVVWNPWKEKSKAMADLDDEGYKKFVCVESTNTRKDEKVIEPQKSHTLSVTYTMLKVKEVL